MPSIEYPSNLTLFTSAQALSFYQENLRDKMPNLLGDTKAQMIDFLQKPLTKRELENLSGKPYQTVNSAMKDLQKRGVVGKTSYQHQKGFSFYVNFKALLEHIATTDIGTLLLAQYGIESPLQKDWGVNTTNIYKEFPEPKGPVLPLKFGNEQTDIFKVIVMSSDVQSKLAQLFYGAANIIQHVWFRSYSLTAGGKNPDEVATWLPDAADSRAALRAFSKQIRDYSKMFDELVDNELIWAENPNYESWRVIGDIPYQWAAEAAQRIVDSWDHGKITRNGHVRSLNEYYEGRKEFISRQIAEQWIEHQNALQKNQEESP